MVLLDDVSIATRLFIETASFACFHPHENPYDTSSRAVSWTSYLNSSDAQWMYRVDSVDRVHCDEIIRF